MDANRHIGTVERREPTGLARHGDGAQQHREPSAGGYPARFGGRDVRLVPDRDLRALPERDEPLEDAGDGVRRDLSGAQLLPRVLEERPLRAQTPATEGIAHELRDDALARVALGV